jgi:cell division protein FtsB
VSTYRQHVHTEVHRRATRKRHPLLRIRYAALILICGWAVFYYLHTERPQLLKLQAQHQQLQSQLSQLKSQQQTLAQEKQQLNSKSYIEKYAADHYGRSMPNQVPFDLQNSSQHG